MDFLVEQSAESDRAGIETLYPEAFPDEDLLPVVRSLLSYDGPVFSFVARAENKIAGHIAFTRCAVEGADGAIYLLGPLAVAPSVQRQGIGTALIREGIATVSKIEPLKVLVLGDPAYYGKAGFIAERSILPPYSLPSEWDGAWQSFEPGTHKTLSGKIVVPEPWQPEALWLP